MFIKRLAVKGFRSLADVVWEPGKLNVLIGPNGGGKSNLLRLLQLLSNAARGDLRKQIQREGGIEAIIFDGTARSVEIACRAEKPVLDTFDYRLRLRCSPPRYYVASEHLEWRDEEDAKSVLLDRRRTEASLLPDEGDSRVLPPDKIDKREALISVLTALSEWSEAGQRFRGAIDSITVYPGLDTDPSAPVRQASVVSFEKSVNPSGENMISVLHTLYTTDRKVKNELNLAMKAAFGDDFEELVFPPASDQRIQLRVRWESLKREQSAADLSDGTLRFLFLLSSLMTPDRPSLIAIEEPETGLHPSMLSVIAEFAAEASERSQVIFTTHSPAFLDAIGRYNPTVTVVESEDGKTQMKNVAGDDLKYWLDQFTLGEIYRSGQLESMG